MQSFRTVEKYVAQENKKKKEKNNNHKNTLFRSHANGQRTHSAQTNEYKYISTVYKLIVPIAH